MSEVTPDAPRAVRVERRRTKRWPWLASLGVRLTLFIVAFILLLAAATATLLTTTLRDVQRDAAELSTKGLEVQAHAALVQVAEREARLIDAQLEKAADMARSAAGYLVAQLGAETPARWNTSNLSRTPEGVTYDANPRRRSDVWIPNFLALEGRTLRDLTASSVLDPLFSTFLALDPDAVAIYYISTEGALRYYPTLDLQASLSPSLDLTEKASYSYVPAAPNRNPEQRTIWSNPYIDVAGQGRLATATTPVYATGAFRGVIGVDVSLARLATRLGELEPAPGGYAFVVDRLGRLVSAPPEALKPLLKQAKTTSSLQSLADIGDATFRASVREMRRGESGSGQLMLAGEQVMMAYAPLPNLGWSLALVTPQRELTRVSDNLVAAIGRDAGDAVRSSLLLTAAFFLLGLIGVTTFSRQFLTAPIARLTKAARAVAAGDLNVTLPLTSRNDLGVLAESFNHMTRELSANEARLKAQSEALAESEARFRMMADTAPVMVWMSGHDDYEDYFNKQWLDFTGRSAEQEAGKGWLEGVHHDDVERCVKAYEQAYAAQQAFEVDYRLRRADGVYRWVLDRGSPRFHADGSFAGFIGSCFDVTERIESRALLEQRVRERTRELTTLLETSKSVTLTLDLEPLLQLILSKLKAVVDHDGAAVFRLEQDALRLLAYQGPLPQDALHHRWSLSEAQHCQEVIARRAPVVIPDVWEETPLAAAFREVAVSQLGEVPAHIRTWMGVPLISRDKVIGVLSFDHSEAGYYTPARAELALAFASQVAVAKQNARLYAQAQGKAALEERQKLARELHDSVSQALFGIALGTKTALAQLERDPAQSADPMRYVLNLAEAGLAEMRALIFELRPESLAQEGLKAALAKHAAALRARHNLTVETSFAAEPDLPLSTKEALYRVSQEALHNIVKHARATKVELTLRQDEGETLMSVQDDGAGFDTTGSFPGHLGLQSMRERVQALGGQLSLESALGKGTTITVRLARRSPGSQEVGSNGVPKQGR